MCSSGRSVSFSAWSNYQRRSYNDLLASRNDMANIEKMASRRGGNCSETDLGLCEHKSSIGDLHFGMTRQCPLEIGPISMNAKIVSVSNSFILHHEHPAIHS